MIEFFNAKSAEEAKNAKKTFAFLPFSRISYCKKKTKGDFYETS